MFREVLESARKPTECLIGILKARFWILKNPLRMQSKTDITNAIYTCSILHNMLLQYDGLDKLWTAEDWLTLDPSPEYSDDENDEAMSDKNKKKRFKIRPERLHEYHLPTGASDETTFVESGHFVLKAALLKNLKYLWDKGEVEHLRYPKTK